MFQNKSNKFNPFFILQITYKNINLNNLNFISINSTTNSLTNLSYSISPVITQGVTLVSSYFSF